MINLAFPNPFSLHSHNNLPRKPQGLIPLCPTFLPISHQERIKTQVTPHHLDFRSYTLCITPHWYRPPFFLNFQNPWTVSPRRIVIIALFPQCRSAHSLPTSCPSRAPLARSSALTPGLTLYHWGNSASLLGCTSFWKFEQENLFPSLYKLLKAACNLWLRDPLLNDQSQEQVISFSGHHFFCFPLTLSRHL